MNDTTESTLNPERGEDSHNLLTNEERMVFNMRRLCLLKMWTSWFTLIMILFYMLSAGFRGLNRVLCMYSVCD